MNTLGHFIRLVLALLCAAAALRANVGVTPVFTFDTRDANASHVAASGDFTLDTRSSNSTHYGETASFAFDTRANSGLSGNGGSGIFMLDTRATLAGGLALVGPSAVAGGSTTEYRVAYRAGNVTSDVTVQCTLAFTGAAPSWAGIGGTTLFVNRNAPVGAVTLQATWRHTTGQFLSAPLTVSVTKPLRAGMAATAQHTSGSNYTVTVGGTAAGGLPPYYIPMGCEWGRHLRGRDREQRGLRARGQHRRIARSEPRSDRRQREPCLREWERDARPSAGDQ